MVTISTSNGKSGILIGLLFLIIGLGVAAWGVMEVKKGKASLEWPTVDGKITHSEVDRHRETHRSNNSTRRETKYSADIRYTYVYEGSSYNGKRVAFGGTRKGSRSKANRIADQYPAGKTVQVYVDPLTPSTACLQPGVGGTAYIPLGIGVVFALVGLGTAVTGAFRRN